MYNSYSNIRIFLILKIIKLSKCQSSNKTRTVNYLIYWKQNICEAYAKLDFINNERKAHNRSYRHMLVAPSGVQQVTYTKR